MTTKSELLELARLMEREPHHFTINEADGEGNVAEVGCGIEVDSGEWSTIIDALRLAAQHTPAAA